MSERRARWAGRGAALVGVAVLALNVGWIGTHWSEVRPVARGDVAPPFALPRADGAGEIRLDDLRGEVVVIDFWATWCKPCVESMPAIGRLYERFHERGLEVVSVNTEGPEARDEALAFARRLELPFPVAIDDGYVASRYKVTTIPHLVVVDRRGVVREVHRGVGAGFEARLAALVERLIRED